MKLLSPLQTRPTHPSTATPPRPIRPLNRIERSWRPKASTSEYKLYLAVCQALKKQLLAAVGNIYVNELAHPTLRYATVTIRDLLAHLFLTYGQITSDQLKANTTELERPGIRPNPSNRYGNASKTAARSPNSATTPYR